MKKLRFAAQTEKFLNLFNKNGDYVLLATNRELADHYEKEAFNKLYAIRYNLDYRNYDMVEEDLVVLLNYLQQGGKLSIQRKKMGEEVNSILLNDIIQPIFSHLDEFRNGWDK